ncbi:hypothetical protein L1887_58037 [Cichorium endivia]|nr:hypothetical protein L1887_58037 [Cichorium endivia]
MPRVDVLASIRRFSAPCDQSRRSVWLVQRIHARRPVSDRSRCLASSVGAGAHPSPAQRQVDSPTAPQPAGPSGGHSCSQSSGGSASAQGSRSGAFQIGRSLNATADRTGTALQAGINRILIAISDLSSPRRHPSSPPTAPSPSSPFLLHPPPLTHDALDIAPRYISLTPPSPSAHDSIFARSVNLYTHVPLARDPVLLLILGSRSIIALSIRQACRPSYLSRTFSIARYAAGHCTISPP